MDSEVVKRLISMSQAGELDGIVELSRATTEEFIDLGRLDWSPNKNWIENEGGLPRYIETVAIGIMKGTGYPRERAIPIAISRIKRWAAGLDGVKADTKAKAIAALAQWEKMKASAAAKRAAKG